VAALRCGLDYTAWRDGTCKELTGEAYSVTDYQYGKLPPYDPARAYRLYEALLGGAEDLIKNKTHL
jgi:hypothetical protein